MSDNQSSPLWANSFESFPKPFKIKDGETKTLKFLSDGTVHHDRKNNKDDIVFIVELDGEKQSWYVNSKSYSTLADIRDLDFPLSGKVITLQRKGSGRFDTRYTITLNK